MVRLSSRKSSSQTTPKPSTAAPSAPAAADVVSNASATSGNKRTRRSETQEPESPAATVKQKHTTPNSKAKKSTSESGGSAKKVDADEPSVALSKKESSGKVSSNGEQLNADAVTLSEAPSKAKPTTDTTEKQLIKSEDGSKGKTSGEQRLAQSEESGSQPLGKKSAMKTTKILAKAEEPETAPSAVTLQQQLGTSDKSKSVVKFNEDATILTIPQDESALEASEPQADPVLVTKVELPKVKSFSCKSCGVNVRMDADKPDSLHVCRKGGFVLPVRPRRRQRGPPPYQYLGEEGLLGSRERTRKMAKKTGVGSDNKPDPERDAWLRNEVMNKVYEKDGQWCRYCGAEQSSQWSRGPWGSRKLCTIHYVQWFKKKRLDLTKYVEEPIEPINRMANTEYDWLKKLSLRTQKEEEGEE